MLWFSQVSGVNGLGAEIAKNIILAQLGAVTLHDTATAQLSDLGAHCLSLRKKRRKLLFLSHQKKISFSLFS
jgi:molybdopterin/thiamine biosynthesis adenylyltransferase